MKTIQPMDCFLPENLPPGTVPIYEVDPGVDPVGITEGGGVGPIPLLDGSFRRDHRFVVPMATATLTDDEAWNVLMAAASEEPLYKAVDVLESKDTPFAGLVRKGGVTLAVTESQYLGRLCTMGPKSGMAIFNPAGVIRVIPSPSEDEIAVFDVMRG